MEEPKAAEVKQEWFSTIEVAKITGYEVQTIERAIHKGTLKAVKFPETRQWRIHRSAIHDWIRRGVSNV